MRHMTTALLAVLLALEAAAPREGRAQDVDSARTWQSVAARIEPGREVQLRLRSGQRFAATLLRVEDQAIIVVPKTRLPVPPQPIAYDQIFSLELRDAGRVTAAKMVAIGVGAGAAAFLGVLLIALATLD